MKHEDPVRECAHRRVNNQNFGEFIALIICLLILFAMISPAHAAGEACTGIRDYDRRQACLAEARGQPDQCASIKDQDQRTICQVRAKMRRER